MEKRNNKILAGAASLSAINFVAPVFMDKELFNTEIEEVVLFIHSDVQTSMGDAGNLTSSTRGALPLPLLIRTRRKEVCQAHLPLYKRALDTSKEASQFSTRPFLHFKEEFQ
jgi:hypothetical protein